MLVTPFWGTKQCVLKIQEMINFLILPIVSQTLQAANDDGINDHVNTLHLTNLAIITAFYIG